MLQFANRLWELVRPYRLRLGLGVATGILAGLIEPLMIATIAVVYGIVFPSGQGAGVPRQLAYAPSWFQEIAQAAQAAVIEGTTQHRGALVLVIAAIPLVMVLRGLTSYLNVYFLQWTSIRAVTDLRVRLFTHLLGLPASFFSRSNTGELMSRISNDTNMLNSVISNSLSDLIRQPVTLVSLAAYLLWQQPKLTLISLVVLPVCVAPIVIYSRKVRRSTAAIQDHVAELSTVMTESFTAHRIVKAFNLEHAMAQRFRDTANKFIGHYMRVVRAMEVPGPLLEFFGSIGVALVFLYLAFNAGPRTSSSDFLAFILAVFSMYRPIKTLTRLHSQFEQARAASDRVFELLTTESTIKEPAQPKPLQARKADVHFDRVSFDYGARPVLQEVELTVKAGQVVALVGASGSGKTTLTNLLMRFYDPTAGAVRIGGTDLRDVTSRDLRNQIAIVTQETILFNETIRANIELGRPGASLAEIQEAAKHAHAHDFIVDKPQGYDSVIGEKGVALSGGQRQRLAIARAILKNAPILILDEATSALDTESERAVQDALEELMQGRTTICIAHRLSTIQKADLIVVMDQGRIVETGTHSELLKQGGTYQRLYELQFQS